MQIKHLCVLIHIRIKGEVGPVEFKPSSIFIDCSNAVLLLWSLLLFEPRHEIPNDVVCATSQPAHTCSLLRLFASRLTILRLLSN